MAADFVKAQYVVGWAVVARMSLLFVMGGTFIQLLCAVRLYRAQPAAYDPI